MLTSCGFGQTHLDSCPPHPPLCTAGLVLPQPLAAADVFIVPAVSPFPECHQWEPRCVQCPQTRSPLSSAGSGQGSVLGLHRAAHARLRWGLSPWSPAGSPADEDRSLALPAASSAMGLQAPGNPRGAPSVPTLSAGSDVRRRVPRRPELLCPRHRRCLGGHPWPGGQRAVPFWHLGVRDSAGPPLPEGPEGRAGDGVRAAQHLRLR